MQLRYGPHPAPDARGDDGGLVGIAHWLLDSHTTPSPSPSRTIKLLLGRDPVAGESLASQPTLSRFENAAGRGALYDMGCELAARVVERHRRRLGRVRRITIDLDPTDDPTHGSQQYSLFNGYYDNWCYLPLLAFLTFDREPEQYLCSAVLRHGKAVASEGGVALLARLLPLLRCAFPRARFLVRLDGGFALVGSYTVTSSASPSTSRQVLQGIAVPNHRRPRPDPHSDERQASRPGPHHRGPHGRRGRAAERGAPAAPRTPAHR